MKPLLLFFFAGMIAVLAMLSSCHKDAIPAPMPIGPCDATKKNTALEKIWQNDLPGYVSSPYISMLPLLYGNNVVYSGGYGANQKLIVANGKTGAILLEKSIDFNGFLPYFQVYGDYLYYKKSTNGVPVRRISLNDNAPASDFTAFPGETAAYFSFYGNALLAVQADSAVILKSTGTGAERTLFAHPAPIAPPLLWNLPNGDTVLTVLYYSAAKYHLESRNITTGKTLFSIEPAQRNGIYFETYAFFLHNGMACLASGDYLDCYDVQFGTLRWSYKSPYTPFAIGGGSLAAFGYGDLYLGRRQVRWHLLPEGAKRRQIWRQHISVKSLSYEADPTFIDQRMFFVYTPRLQAYNLGAACTDWDFLPPNASNNNFRNGIAYHPGLKTLFRDDGHILAIRYQD